MPELNYAEQFDQHQEGVDLGLQPVETTFTDMVRATLNAILKQDRDAEMHFRSNLKTECRVSDSQITRELFKTITATEVAVAKKSCDSLDLSKVEALTYFKWTDGFRVAMSACFTGLTRVEKPRWRSPWLLPLRRVSRSLIVQHQAKSSSNFSSQLIAALFC